MPRWSAVARPAVLAAPAVLIGVLATGPLTAAAAPAAGPGAPARGPVVLIGTGGLRWSDLSDTTPGLQALLSDGAVGDLSVRASGTVTCPVDGWLTLSAGASVTGADPAARSASPSDGRCRAPAATFTTAGGPATADRWSTYLARTGGGGPTAAGRLGMLAAALSLSGTATAAVGPGAVLALADARGRVRHAWPGVTSTASDSSSTSSAGGPPHSGSAPGSSSTPSGDGGIDPGADSAALADQVTAALATRPGLLVIDAGAVRDSSAVPRSQQVNALDSRIQLVVGALPAGATVLLASLADSGSSDHLQLLATTGLDGEPTGHPAGALLTDGSGGQDGVARLVDLTPTLLHALGVAPPASLPGSALRPTGPTGDLAGRLERVVDLDRADRAVRTEAGRFLLGLVVLQLVLYLGTLLVLRRPPVPPAGVPSRVRVLRTLRWCAVGVSALPAAGLLAGLIPWWRESGPGLAAVVAVATFWLPLAGLALLGPWRSAPLGPAAAVGTLTALVATAAAVTGPRMSSAGLLRLQDLLDSAITPAAGIAGPRTTLLGAGAALAATGAATLAPPRHRRAVVVGTVAAIGALAVVVTAAVGGAPGESPEGNLAAGLALLPAFGVLLAATTGHRAAARSLFVLLAAGLVLAALPVAAHGWRVVEADRAALTLPITWLLPVAAGFVVLVLGRPTGWGVTPLTAALRRIPVLDAGLAAFALWLAPTLAVLPAGPALAGLACGFVVPLLVAAVARVLELEAVDDLAAAVTAVRRQGHGRGRSPRVAGRPAAGPPSTAR